MLSTVLELAGWLATGIALFFICPLLAVVWVGLTLMVVGYVMGDE